MFVTLTHATRKTPVLVNLDRLLYAYREEKLDVTVLVFGQIAEPSRGFSKPGRIRLVAVAVDETLLEIQEKRRLA